MSKIPTDMLFSCPFCKQQLKAPHEYAGEIGECPACQKEITIPSSIASDREKPVFLDPGNVRWPWMRRVFFAVSFTFFVSLVCLCISIVINPVLPSLRLGDSEEWQMRVPLAPPTARRTELNRAIPLNSHIPRAQRNARTLLEKRWRRSFERPGPADTIPWKNNYPEHPDAVSTDRPLTMAFAVTSDIDSINSLKQNKDKLDVLIPEWLKLLPDGKIELLKAGEQVEISQALAASPPAPRLVPLISNYDNDNGWLGTETGRLLLSGSVREGIITALLEYKPGFPVHGFCVNFNGIPPEFMNNYLAFIRELADSLHAKKKNLYVCIPADIPPQICRRIAQTADMVIVMAHSQHSEPAEPGPLAAEDWFESVIQRRARDIPPTKLVIAFGNYARDWRRNKPDVALESFDKAMMTACEQRAIVRLDQASLNPGFCYMDAVGQRHEVWMLDAVTAFNQLSAARKLKPRGVALWRLGNEDSTLWRFFCRTNTVDAQACRLLSDMEFKHGVNFTGKGEIIRIRTTPETGKRRLTFDEKRGQIVGCEYEKLPSPFVVERYGAASNKVALTFDDGPDPAYTTAILDILAHERVRATFFIIGSGAELHPDLLRRMEREGHEIGSHTFTHPNISRITPGQLERELSATQRLLESVIGRHTLLFRPPYGEDTDPATPDDLKSLEIVSKLGYWTVGMHVDPDDWTSPPPAEIVRRTLAQAQAGEGNIVLLHDGGGERAQTVAALPDLITQLREHGFELVTVSELLGSARDELMPPIAGAQRVPASLNKLAFGFTRLLGRGLMMLFMLGIVLGLARLLFIGLLAVMDVLRKRQSYYSFNFRPSVAVIVPGYNEENVICRTISSLLNSKSPYSLEVIVVDDGSLDQTYQRAFDAFGAHPVVRIFRKNNGGKASALNFGISQTTADIVVAVDADTQFAEDTIWKLVRHFENAGVGAVAGNVKVGNRINMLTKWQALEYITSQNLDRRAFNVLDCITVVPGAVGAWRRELVLKAGGFRQSTLAEDADLTIAIRRMGYSIINDAEAYAYTEAPDTIRGFLRQRYRWMYGTLQAAWKHRRALFNPNYGALGIIALPNIIVFQIFFPLISPAIDLLTAWTVLKSFWNMFLGAAGSSNMLIMVLAYFILFTAADVSVVMLALAIEPKEDKRLLWWLFPQRFCYRQLMYYVAIKSALSALRGIEVQWGHVKRKATVTGGNIESDHNPRKRS